MTHERSGVFAPRRSLLPIALIGAVGVAAYIALTDVGVAEVCASALCAVVIGTGGSLVGRVVHVPPFVLVTGALLPLLRDCRSTGPWPSSVIDRRGD